MIKRLFGFLFKRKKEKKEKVQDKDLREMNKEEKKEFLSNDFIERMIRVEKGVSSSFGENIDYNDTRYYKSLSEKEKKKYKKYLRNKERKKYFLIIPMVITALFFFLARTEFTGNVIKERMDVFGYEWFFALFIAVILFYFLIFAAKRIKNKKFEEHFKVLDDINIKRYLVGG